MLESEREDRLFNDHLAKHFAGGERGKQISELLNEYFTILYPGHDNVCVMITAARTMLINDHLTKWIDTTEKNGSKM